MKLNVKTLSGESITIDVDPEESIASVKQKISQHEGIPPEQQRLIFGGKQLDSSNCVSDYNIENDCTLHLVLRLKGGETLLVSFQ